MSNWTRCARSSKASGPNRAEPIRDFGEIHAIARARHGGGLVEKIGNGPRPAAELATIPEDRWLSIFTKVVFQAGFNWQVVENMWDGFETAFHAFDIDTCAFMAEDWFEELCQDRRIVRYPAKIRAVQENALFIQNLRDQGGIARVIADWPARDFAGLVTLLKKDANRLGGSTGQYALRFMGRDGFILSRDVVARLQAEGVIDKSPTSQKALQAVQQAFNIWSNQSGKSLIEISRVLALSI